MPISGLCCTGNVTAKGFLGIHLKSQFLMVKTKSDAKDVRQSAVCVVLATSPQKDF
jgi:hypothetical protein